MPLGLASTDGLARSALTRRRFVGKVEFDCSGAMSPAFLACARGPTLHWESDRSFITSMLAERGVSLFVALNPLTSQAVTHSRSFGFRSAGASGVGLVHDGAGQASLVCGLTFELSGGQRQGARPGLAKMYRVPPDRAWWPAVGAPLERGVRPHWLLAAGPWLPPALDSRLPWLQKRPMR